MRIDRTLLALLLAAPLTVLGGRALPVPANPLDRDRTAEARFYQVKTSGRQRCDVIVLGDSRALRCVAPQELAPAFPGRRIFNFAYNAGGLNPEMYAAASARLDPASPAPLVLIGMTPLALMTPKTRNEQYHEILHKPRDQRWLLLHAPGLLRWFQPTRPSELLRPLVGVPPHTRYFQEFHDDGWIRSRREPEDPESVLESYAEELAGQTTDPVLVQALLDQTRAWTRAGVRVVAFRPPTTEAVEAAENRLLGFDEAALAAQFTAAGGVWLDFANAYASYDGSHLRGDAAVRFSRDLAAALRSRLGAS